MENRKISSIGLTTFSSLLDYWSLTRLSGGETDLLFACMESFAFPRDMTPINVLNSGISTVPRVRRAKRTAITGAVYTKYDNIHGSYSRESGKVFVHLNLI